MTPGTETTDLFLLLFQSCPVRPVWWNYFFFCSTPKVVFYSWWESDTGKRKDSLSENRIVWVTSSPFLHLVFAMSVSDTVSVPPGPRFCCVLFTCFPLDVVFTPPRVTRGLRRSPWSSSFPLKTRGEERDERGRRGRGEPLDPFVFLPDVSRATPSMTGVLCRLPNGPFPGPLCYNVLDYLHDVKRAFGFQWSHVRNRSN